ncbi:unnamed protein product, partial [Meganyctiphanes norvegica]
MRAASGRQRPVKDCKTHTQAADNQKYGNWDDGCSVLLPVRQRSYEGVDDELHEGLDSQHHPDLHVLLHQLLVLRVYIPLVDDTVVLLAATALGARLTNPRVA